MSQHEDGGVITYVETDEDATSGKIIRLSVADGQEHPNVSARDGATYTATCGMDHFVRVDKDVYSPGRKGRSTCLMITTGLTRIRFRVGSITYSGIPSSGIGTYVTCTREKPAH